MRIKLVKVFKGAVYEDQIWDYWLLIQLVNEQIIQVFDSNCFASSLEEGGYYDIELGSSILSDKLDLDSIAVFGNIKTQKNSKYFRNNYLEIKLKDSEEIEESKDTFFSIGRIDLLSVKGNLG